MRDNLDELNRRGLSHIPVILGGAALTRTYVERDLRQVFDGRLFYGKDAFEGLRTMDRLVELSRSGEDDPDFGTVVGGRDLGPRRSELRKLAAAEAQERGEKLEIRRLAAGFGQLARGRDGQPGVRAPLRGQPGGEGYVRRRRGHLPQRDGALPQPVGVPTGERRGRSVLQGADPASAP